MKDNLKKQFTIGEFSKKAGVTLRTLRYYDKIDLLKPSFHNESGYRLYSKNDFPKLQKILTLKFIGLSLDEIKDVMKEEVKENDFEKSLKIQKKIIKEKINHELNVIQAIDEALKMIDTDKNLNWDKFINIINLINKDNKWMKQYIDASNLKARINIHDKFSTNKEGWMEWFFKQLPLETNCKVLELGCGDGSLWAKNYEKIPKEWEIHITDFSEGMVEDAKLNLKANLDRFHFKVEDAENISYEEETFDIVIANHMLYHLNDMDKALSEMQRVLKKDGYIFISTVGENHMKEMREFLSMVDKEILEAESFNLTKKFQIENGLGILSKFFKDIECNLYIDNLKITEKEALFQYMLSMESDIVKKISENKLMKLDKLLEKECFDNGYIYISKHTGYFKGKK
ncbi:MerR family transcriptional regulator [Clostridium sp. CTA-7]